MERLDARPVGDADEAHRARQEGADLLAEAGGAAGVEEHDVGTGGADGEDEPQVVERIEERRAEGRRDADVGGEGGGERRGAVEDEKRFVAALGEESRILERDELKSADAATEHDVHHPHRVTPFPPSTRR